MSQLFDEFPDVEAMIGELLRAEFGDTVRVTSSIPRGGNFPLVTITRIGGLPVERHRVEHATLQFDCYADTKGAAYDLAAQVRAIVMEAEETGDYARGFISGVLDELGMTYIPDTNSSPPLERYTFGLGVYCHS